MIKVVCIYKKEATDKDDRLKAFGRRLSEKISHKSPKASTGLITVLGLDKSMARQRVLDIHHVELQLHAKHIVLPTSVKGPKEFFKKFFNIRVSARTTAMDEDLSLGD